MEICYSFTESGQTLCDPMNCSTPGFPVFHCLPEFAQGHVYLSHWLPSKHLFLCCPFPLLPSIFASIRVLSNESSLHIRWPVYWSQLQHQSSLVDIQGWCILGLSSLISLLSKGLSRLFSSTTVQKHQFFSPQPSLWSNSHICTWLLEKPVVLTIQTLLYLWLYRPLLQGDTSAF